MAATPGYKIYSSDDEYHGSVKYLEDAAAFVSFLGTGATVRLGHSKSHILWAEGREEFEAGRSYDEAAQTMEKRVHQIRTKARSARRLDWTVAAGR